MSTSPPVHSEPPHSPLLQRLTWGWVLILVAVVLFLSMFFFFTLETTIDASVSGTSESTPGLTERSAQFHCLSASKGFAGVTAVGDVVDLTGDGPSDFVVADSGVSTDDVCARVRDRLLTRGAVVGVLSAMALQAGLLLLLTGRGRPARFPTTRPPTTAHGTL